MPDTGFLIAGSGANVDQGGVDWADPGNITADDAALASVSLNELDDSFSDRLTSGSHGVSLPSGATVNGIEVRAELSISEVQGQGDINWQVYLTKNGSTSVGNSDSSLPEGLIVFGGASYLWGTTWTEAEVESANFGAMLDAFVVSGDPTALVDRIEVKVHYTEGGGDATVIVPSAAIVMASAPLPPVPEGEEEPVVPTLRTVQSGSRW